ncbi:MAG: class I SAM-dependent DNA methyltransferase, partial [Thermoproteota archaeon]
MIGVEWSVIDRLEGKDRRRYLTLLEEFGSRKFTAEEAERLLNAKNLGLENINKLISVMLKSGLLRAEVDPHDFRRKIYSFILPEVPPSEKRVPTRDELIRLLKSCADLIRTAVDYKALLLFLFYKAASDKWQKKVERYKREGFSEEEAYLLANSEYLKLYDEEERKSYSWHEVTRSRETIKEIANAVIKISRMNTGLSDLQKLVEVLGLLGFISEDNMSILEGLVQLFNKYDFSDVDYDAIGDAYQWVLFYFAPQKAKEGETYTPREIIKLIVQLLDIENGSSVLDPACGSGAMLIEAYNYAKEKLESKKPYLDLTGQELNETMAVIAKMNMILHGIEGYELYVGNSLTRPRFDKADYVIANPPWNQDGYDESNLGEPAVRKIYTSFVNNGFTPRTTADWAWVQLMLYYATKKVGIVLDQGALFRGGKEESIRSAIVEKDLLEAVILLPDKLFYNVTAPGIVAVFN